MTLIMLGKLLSSISDRNVGTSCFNEHMIEKTCEKGDNFRGVAPAPFMRKCPLVKYKTKIMT